MPRSRVADPQSPSPQDDTAQAMIRREHAGKWLAWAEDESRIVAVGGTAEEVRTAAERAGVSRFIYDWVPPIGARQTTGLG
jgi:hypothetical protein